QTNALPFWSLVQEGAARGSMSLDLTNPLTEATPRSLRLEIEQAGPGRIGIANGGFWGIGTRQGKTYELSFWARAEDGFSGPLTAVLEADGKACTKPEIIKGVGAQWKKFKTSLTATGSESKARLVITAASRGKVWFDLVSLFPAQTFKGHG